MGDIQSSLHGHLEFLYTSDADSVLDDLLQLMESFEGRLGAGPRRQLTEKDVALITYGDMVTEAGRPPLASLGDFLTSQVADVLNTVHILPFYPYSSDDGFSVIDFLEVDSALGGWRDVEGMGGSFHLMFDAVLNHISASSEWFEGFRNGDERYQDFFTVVEPGTDVSEVFRPRELPLLTEVDTAAGLRHVWTTFSADQVDLNYRNPAVLLATVEVLLTYVARGADAIRLDAVTFLWKELGTSCIHLPQTHRIIQLFRTVLNAVAPAVILITETNVPHEENISYFGDGSNEADLVYNFALPPLVLQAFHTGDAQVLSSWAEQLEAPAGGATFFNFLASHDGIGVGGARGWLSEVEIEQLADRTRQLGGGVGYRRRPDGSRTPYELNINFLDALGDPAEPDTGQSVEAERFLTSQAIMLALSGVPGVYFHSLFGSRGWPEGVEATGSRRAINREKLELRRLETELADPESLRHLVLQGFRRLLQSRTSHPAFSPQADQEVLFLHPALFAIWRGSPATGQFVLCLHNVTADQVDLTVDSMVLPESVAEGVVDLISGERLYGDDGPLTVQVEPFQTLWLAGPESNESI